MLRQTPCEKSTVEKDVIGLEFSSPRTFAPSVLLSEGNKRGEAGQRQRGKRNGLKRSDLTQVYWIHAWSRPPSESGADVWPLGLISHMREEKKVVEPSRPQLLISEENIWVLQPTVASYREEEIWSHFGGLLARMWMNDFDLVNISFRLALELKNSFNDVTELKRNIMGDMFERGYCWAWNGLIKGGFGYIWSLCNLLKPQKHRLYLLLYMCLPEILADAKKWFS